MTSVQVRVFAGVKSTFPFLIPQRY